MRRARAARVLAAGALGSACLILLSGCGEESEGDVAAATSGPNVLVIVTDDQRADQLRFLPKTHRRLDDALTFTDAFVTTPLCCPSRASIFSGKYAHNHGITGNVAISHGAVEAFDTEDTWPEELREAGYRTGLAGKYMNHWPTDERPPMFDFFSWAEGSDARKAHERIDDLRYEAARKFVTSSEENDSQPWALTLALHAPHTSYDPPRKYRDFDPGPLPDNAATHERDISDKAASVRDLQANPKLIADSWEGQAQTLRAADDLIGKLLNVVDEEGERGRTLVIFTSDNGYMTGEHGLTKKVWPYLPSISVPMVLSWPGHLKGGTSDDIVANIDIAPTVLDATGIDPDYELDGRSMLSGKPRDWLFLEGPRQKSRSPYDAWEAYIDHDTHVIEWRDAQRWQELYDLQADPFEVESKLAGGDAAHAAEAAPYLEKIEAAKDCAGAGCP